MTGCSVKPVECVILFNTLQLNPVAFRLLSDCFVFSCAFVFYSWKERRLSKWQEILQLVGIPLVIFPGIVGLLSSLKTPQLVFNICSHLILPFLTFSVL